MQIGVGLVADGELDLSALEKRIQNHFGKARTPSLITRLNEIPRNTMGKIMREVLAQSNSQQNRK